ncbi:MAG TPA: GRRM system radical SAM/SPASM domain protein [Burkholderiaceae bacterium]|nr:GRRM system radical SAM/SPASM domain protein [Burkholderiaceae bacterium]
MFNGSPRTEGRFGRSRRRSSSSILTLDSFKPRPTNELLVLQPTAFCNLACDYCYLPNRDSPEVMIPETASRTVERLIESNLLGSVLNVCWHAGEPLVAGRRFFREAIRQIDEVSPPTTVVRHAIQTNATLIDDSWCDLFLELEFSVGVSIDGPEAIHDRHRKTRSGKGSLPMVLRGVSQLRRRGVPFHVIAVLNAESLPDPGAYLDFFEGLGIEELCLNIDEAEGDYARSSFQSRDGLFREFYERLIDEAEARQLSFGIREFSRSVAAVLGDPARIEVNGEFFPSNAQTVPMQIISVARDGKFSTFSPELQGALSLDGFCFGNVWTDSFEQAIGRPEFQKTMQRILAGVRVCKSSCPYFSWCGGGAPANKYFENGDFTTGTTTYCRTAVQIPFDDALKRLELAAGTTANLEKL